MRELEKKAEELQSRAEGGGGGGGDGEEETEEEKKQRVRRELEKVWVSSDFLVVGFFDM